MKIRRICALFFSLLLVLTLAAPALAADGTADTAPPAEDTEPSEPVEPEEPEELPLVYEVTLEQLMAMTD